MSNMQYFYDGQIERIIRHFLRIFDGFQVKSFDSENNPIFTRVPVKFGGGSRQVETILRNNSEVTVLSVPRIAIYITGLDINRSLTRYAGLADNVLIDRRKTDVNTGELTGERGDSFHIKRLVPNPLKITMQTDLWTSNLDQKLQLFEQIYIIFNPAIDMQTTNNPLDWNSIKKVELTSVNWSNLAIPKGTDEELQDIATLTFDIESDINPPASVSRQTLIHTIIDRIAVSETPNENEDFVASDCLIHVTTPGNHVTSYDGNELTLLGPTGNLKDENGNIFSWAHLIDLYGELVEGTSRIRLRWGDDIEDITNDFIGFIKFKPGEANKLIFNADVDTIPSPSLLKIDRIIDPKTQTPGNNLPAATLGQRYIITGETSSSDSIWMLNASVNDIIEFNGTVWVISRDASVDNTEDILVNNETAEHLRFRNNVWETFLRKNYAPGFWRILL